MTPEEYRTQLEYDAAHPGWREKQERDDAELVRMAVPTDDEVRAECQRQADALSAQLAPLIEHQRTMRELADGLPARQASLDGYRRLATEQAALAEQADLDGDAETALATSEKATTAQRMFEAKQPGVLAATAQLEQWNLAAHDAEIATLTEQRDGHLASAADPTRRDHIVAEFSAKQDAARERNAERAWNQLRMWAREREYNSPENFEARAREAHAQAEDNRQRMMHIGPYAPAPPAPRSQRGDVAALAALARLKQGGRVDPVAVSLHSTGGPLNPGRY